MSVTRYAQFLILVTRCVTTFPSPAPQQVMTQVVCIERDCNRQCLNQVFNNPDGNAGSCISFSSDGHCHCVRLRFPKQIRPAQQFDSVVEEGHHQLEEVFCNEHDCRRNCGEVLHDVQFHGSCQAIQEDDAFIRSKEGQRNNHVCECSREGQVVRLPAFGMETELPIYAKLYPATQPH